MYRKLIVGIVAAVTLAGIATVGWADHSWNGYHWRSDNLAPTVANNASPRLYDVPAGVTEWAALGTPIQPTLVAGTKGNITVTEAFSPFWLGLARIFVEDGHITKGEVKLNTRLLESYGPAAADHVLCQELGHVLGLDHNRQELDTCMNDKALLGSATSPNAHDAEQLNLIYDHADAVDGGGDGGGNGGGPPCDKNPDHPNCQSGNGVWITIHAFPVP